MRLSLFIFALFCLFSVSLCRYNSITVNNSVKNVAAYPNFGLGISNGAFNDILSDFVFPDVVKAIEGVAAELPPYCCYDDVEVKHVHLMFQNLALPSTTIEVSGNTSSSSFGVAFDLDVDFQFQFFLRLCVHDDPFGGGCSTLFGCKGDIDLYIDTSVDFTIVVEVDQNGFPSLTAHDVAFNLALPQMVGLCSTFKDGINAAIPSINQNVNEKLGPAINSALASALSKLSQTITVNDVFDINWALSLESGTQTTGMGFVGEIDVVLNQQNNTIAPFVPVNPLPNILTILPANNIGLSLTDSLFNNFIYAYYSTLDMAIEFHPIVGNKTTTLTLNLTGTPTVTFRDEENYNATSINLLGSFNFKDGLISVKFDANITMAGSVEIQTTGTPGIVLQVSPTDFDIVLSHVFPPLPVKDIEAEIEKAWASVIPEINSLLLSHAITLPTALSGATITYGDSYILLADSLSSASTLEEITNFDHPFYDFIFTFNKSLIQEFMPETLPCPNLSGTGAHQDDCST